MKVFEIIKDIDFRKQYVQRLSEEKTIQKEYLLSVNFLSDLEQLKLNNYALKVPFKVYLPKGKNKKRVVYNYDDKTNALLGIINASLHKYDYKFPKCCYSHLRNKGIRSLFQEIKNNQSVTSCFKCVMDFSNFGESIDASLLTNEVISFIDDDEELLTFLSQLINDKHCNENGKLVNEASAIKPGNALGTFLEDIFMLPFDKEMEKRTTAYYRYCDDFVFYCKSKESLNDVIEYVCDYVTSHKLKINKEKMQVKGIGESYEIFGSIVDGNVIHLTALINYYKRLIGIKKAKALKTKRKYGLTSQEVLSWFLKTIHFDSQEAIIKLLKTIDNAEAIKEIDLYIQNALRQIGSDKKTNAKYRIRYSNIKEAGYYSLLNIYYEQMKK